MVYKCLHGQAPDYLSELCVPFAQVAERQHFRSASCNLLVASRFQLNTYGRRAFAMAAPATWNLLSDELQNPDLHSASFRRNLKTFLFLPTIPGALSALEVLCDYALYKSTFTACCVKYCCMGMCAGVCTE